MILVKDHTNLYRDEKTGAIINTDSVGYNQYKRAKSFKNDQKEEIERIKKDIEEIKYLLKQIVQK